MSQKCLYTTLISLSILFLVLSIGALIIFTNIDLFINEQIKKEAPFINGSKPLAKWSKPAEDTTFKFTLYLWNVTNPDAIVKGERPRVVEMGPYEFIQKKEFTLYNWEADDTLLNYKMTRRFYRDSTCKGNLNDKVTLLNVPLITFASLIKSKTENANFLVKAAADRIMKFRLKAHDRFITQSVGDVLWNGYKDDFTRNIAFLENLLSKAGVKLDGPSAISKDGYFSLLGQKNNSDYGLWSINTGKKDLGLLGQLELLDRTNCNVSCWRSNCSSIRGTDGLVHHPFIKDTDRLPVFEPELNRTVFLTFERNTNYNGIPTKRFLLDVGTFQAPSKNPYNKCFCPTNDSLKDFDGTLRVGHCNFHVPMVFSNPHFYQADSYFGEQIHGFKPNKVKHESFADISKELGMVINGRKTIQLNIDTQAYASYLTNSQLVVPRQIFPVFWLIDSGSAGPSSISELKSELYDKVENIKKYLIIFIAIFIAGFIVPMIYMIVDFTMYWNDRNEDSQNMITNDDNSNLNNNNQQTKDAHNVISDGNNLGSVVDV